MRRGFNAQLPDSPEVQNGYLDLLGEDRGRPQEEHAAIWSSQTLSTLYDYGQSLARTVMTTLPASETRLPDGARVLDVGCGPGNAAMLERAVRAEDAPQVCFPRADACRLPFQDNSFDAVVGIAAVHNTPEPLTVLGGSPACSHRAHA